MIRDGDYIYHERKYTKLENRFEEDLEFLDKEYKVVERMNLSFGWYDHLNFSGICFRALVYLEIASCGLETFTFDQHSFPCLLTLDLDHNDIEDVSLLHLTKLESLSLHQNQIEFLTVPEGHSLTYINMSGNVLLSVFHSPPSVTLNLKDTPVSNYDPLKDGYYLMIKLVLEHLPQPLAEEIIPEI